MKKYIISAKSLFATELDNTKYIHVYKEKNKKYWLKIDFLDGRGIFYLGCYSS